MALGLASRRLSCHRRLGGRALGLGGGSGGRCQGLGFSSRGAFLGLDQLRRSGAVVLGSGCGKNMRPMSAKTEARVKSKAPRAASSGVAHQFI